TQLTDADEFEEELFGIEDETIPLSSFRTSSWSLTNFIMVVFTVITSIMLMFKNKNRFRLLSILPAIVSTVSFILTQNMTNSMVIVDEWTLMMSVVAIIQGIVIILSISGKKDHGTQTQNK
ncbi:MAG: hypothetical protein RSC41_02675, partial [Oscillospiraceae bacterium]